MSAERHGSTAIDGWAFSWLPADASLPAAQLSVRLHWQGAMLDLMADGLAGVDGRLDAPALHSLPEHLRSVVLSHFAEPVLQALGASPLAALGGVALLAMHWHEVPVAMTDGWPFVVRAPGVMGCSVGRLCVRDALGRPDEAAQNRLLAALAVAGAPLPEGLAAVVGRLGIAQLELAREELAALDTGDWVWLPDAQITPRGLRAQFKPFERKPACTVWLHRGHMQRCGDAQRGEIQRGDLLASEGADTQSPGDDDGATALLPLRVVGPALGVPPAWWHGAQTRVPLPGPVLAERWVAMAGAVPWFEGQLRLHGRRLALQVTRVLHHDASAAMDADADADAHAHAATGSAATTTTTPLGA